DIAAHRLAEPLTAEIPPRHIQLLRLTLPRCDLVIRETVHDDPVTTLRLASHMRRNESLTRLHVDPHHLRRVRLRVSRDRPTPCAWWYAFARLGPTPFTDRAASAGVAPLSNMAKMTDASIAPDNCTSPMRSAHASWNAAYPNGSHALYSMICFKVSSVARRFSRSESHSLNAVLLSIDIDIPSCLARTSLS